MIRVGGLISLNIVRRDVYDSDSSSVSVVDDYCGFKREIESLVGLSMSEATNNSESAELSQARKCRDHFCGLIHKAIPDSGRTRVSDDCFSLDIDNGIREIRRERGLRFNFDFFRTGDFAAAQTDGEKKRRNYRERSHSGRIVVPLEKGVKTLCAT